MGLRLSSPLSGTCAQTIDPQRDPVHIARMSFEFTPPGIDIAAATAALDSAAPAWRDAPENPEARRALSSALLGMERLYARIRLRLARVAPAELAGNLASTFAAWHDARNTPETQTALARAVAGMAALTAQMKHDLAAHPAPAADDPRVITTTAALADFCAKAAASPFVAVDTEFMRVETYHAQPCLIQLAISATEAVAVDPLSPGIDLSPLDALLANPDVVKVFHAGQADIEIFHDRTRRVPAPVFDTQVAAGLCGHAKNPGYKALANAVLGIDIDKETQMTDWAVRPLSPRQITYAIGDVSHLCTIYERLRAKLESSGKLGAARKKMIPLTNPRNYTRNPHETWPRPRLRDGNRRVYAAHRALWIWRETQAQKLDVPRSRILRDNVFMDIATRIPKTAEELADIPGLPQGFAEGKMGQSLVAALVALDGEPSAKPPLPHAPQHIRNLL